MLTLVPAFAGAATINVTTTADELNNIGGCSIREAVQIANSDAAFAGCTVTGALGAETIVIPAGEYTLTLPGNADNINVTGDIDVYDDQATTIETSGLAGIDGGQLDRVFHHQGTGLFRIDNLFITGGAPPVMTDGGAVLNSTGTLVVTGSTFANNTSERHGGAIANYANVVIENSTLIANGADDSGGGIYNGMGDTASVRSVTISTNRADADVNNTGDGGGFRTLGTFATVNTLIADNIDEGATKRPDCFVSGGTFAPRYTLVETHDPVTCPPSFDPGTNIFNQDARLAPPSSNGGTVLPTQGLFADSPAIDKGGPPGIDQCPPTDQRGVARPQGVTCDIGAFERIPDPVVPPVVPPVLTPGKCAGKTATKTGTTARDVIKGTAKRDIIAALGGNDKVTGLGGNDLICGGAGKDALSGGKGKDTLKGDAGNDKLLGGAGRDILQGAKGVDKLFGGPARDRLLGGPGKDTQKQ